MFQGVQRHKRRATDAVQIGDIDAARHRYERALRTIRRCWSTIPRERRPDFEHEIVFIKDALARLEIPTPAALSYVSKAMLADVAFLTRSRDRRRPSAS